MINFGKYDQSIVIQNYAETRGANGESIRAYSTLYTVWAKVIPTGGGESQETEEKVASIQINCEVRATGLTINETMRIVWRGNTYNITNIDPFGTRLNEGFLITAVAKDNS